MSEFNTLAIVRPGKEIILKLVEKMTPGGANCAVCLLILTLTLWVGENVLLTALGREPAIRTSESRGRTIESKPTSQKGAFNE